MRRASGQGVCLPGVIRGYVRFVDAINYRLGRIAMYLVFVLIGILLWSVFTKTFMNPSLWTVEMAQFIMVSYFIVGGPYSIQLGSNVRMDLFYGEWTPVTKAWVDAFTVLCLLFYLCVLLYGAVASTAYSLGYFGKEPFGFFLDLAVTFFTAGPEGVSDLLGTLERNATAWRPQLWPVKIVITCGIFLMLLQVLAEFFRDIARIRGAEL